MSAHVRFYNHAAYQPDESQRLGRKVFKDVVFIEIRTSKNSSFSRPMTEKDKYEHPESWGRYCLENVQDSTGTPLKFLPATTTALILQLADREIRSVEDLAAADDVSEIEGAAKLQKQARAYIAAMVDDEPAEEKPKRGRKPKAETQENEGTIAA